MTTKTTKRQQRPAPVCVGCGWDQAAEFDLRFWGRDAHGDPLCDECMDAYRLESEPTRPSWEFA